MPAPLPSTTNHADRTFVVTIDGPAGTGKSSVAREIARQLGFAFLDTGAMYRAVAAVCLEESIDTDDKQHVTATADALEYDATAGNFPTVQSPLRTVAVTEAASRVARHAGVRQRLVEWQREFAVGKQLITEGRDQGTEVFPDAGKKFFLTATADERAQRRVRELQRAGEQVEFEAIRDQIRQRDERDENREVAPLRPADDAEVVDTTGVPIEEVVAKLVQDVRQQLSLSQQM